MKNKILATVGTILIVLIIYGIWTFSSDFVHENKYPDEAIPILTLVGVLLCGLIGVIWYIIYDLLSDNK